MKKDLSVIEIEPTKEADACVIWMHGLGADGRDFVSIIPELALPDSHRIRFVFPSADSIPVTINAGMVMPAWFDIYDLDINAPYDEKGMQLTETRINYLIEGQMKKGIPANRIVLAGFSQGGAVALYTAIRSPHKLGGALALSTYLPTSDAYESNENKINLHLPIFLAHGEHDSLVRIEWGLLTHEHLLSLGFNVDWRSYPVEHSLCIEEILDCGQWLKEVLQLNNK